MFRTLALVTVLVAGCASSQPTEMVEVANPSTAPRPADQLEIQNGNVTVRSVDYRGGDIFEFVVMNLRPEPLPPLVLTYH